MLPNVVEIGLFPTKMASISPRQDESAIQRAPVEVWSRILQLAISCPLLPSDDDSLIVNLYLLQYECETIAAYWDSERLRLSCRLVCRSWKSLLEHYADRLFLAPDLTSTPLFYQRIQLPPNNFQWTPCKRHRAGVQFTCVVPKWHRPDNLIIGRSDSHNVRAFVDYINYSTPTVVDVTPTFPRLQVLSVHAFGDVRKTTVSLPTLSAQCTSLTHLALYLFFQMVEGESQVLVLPNLHTLFVHLITGHMEEIRPVPLSKWRLPRLRNLGMRANLRNDGRGTYDEFQLLIKNVGSSLKGLSFVWRSGRYEESLSHLIWGWCPQLECLEISIRSISKLWPPPETHSQLVIIVMDLKEWDKDLATYGNLLTQITSLPTGRISGRIYSFGMQISWSALRQDLESAVRPRPFLQLLECFQGRGYTFVDRYGISTNAEEAKEIMKWLEEKCGSVLPNPSNET